MDSVYKLTHTLNEKQKSELLQLFDSQSWSQGRTLSDITIIEKSCLIFAVIHSPSDALVGFSRVVTDYLKYAYIHDVIVREDHQQKGIGRYLMQQIQVCPILYNIMCFDVLSMPDTISFYRKYKFDDVKPLEILRFDKRRL